VGTCVLPGSCFATKQKETKLCFAFSKVLAMKMTLSVDLLLRFVFKRKTLVMLGLLAAMVLMINLAMGKRDKAQTKGYLKYLLSVADDTVYCEYPPSDLREFCNS
jgi:hypothetical protein